MEKFIDRYEAGKRLAKQLKDYAHRSDVIVLALPRGGVPVAYEIARALSAPLDVFLVRKLGVPGQEELAMGAISETTVIFNEEVVSAFNISKEAMDRVIQFEQQELRRREKIYRGNRPFPNLEGKAIILVDDGIATGATMDVAIQSLRKHHPASIVLAVPVSEITIYKKMSEMVDQVVCLLRPYVFYAVGEWYEDFPQTTDAEVQMLLTKLKPATESEKESWEGRE